MSGTSIITAAAALRCATHSLQDQLAALREIERQRILKESADRILRDGDELRHRVMPVNDRLVLPLDGAD